MSKYLVMGGPMNGQIVGRGDTITTDYVACIVEHPRSKCFINVFLHHDVKSVSDWWDMNRRVWEGRHFHDCHSSKTDIIFQGVHADSDATKLDPSYASLRRVLDAAYDQSATGKGRARHGNGLDFDQQPIMKIGRMVGAGYPVGQAMKKAQEAIGMARRGEHDAALAELLGVIVYAAAAYLLIEEARGE